MSILQDLDLTNIPEEAAVADGEYEVMITSAEEYIGKTSGKLSIRVILSIPSEANAQDIFHYISIPQQSDDPKTVARKKRRIKEFLDAFSLTPDMPYQTWIGHRSWALIKQETSPDGELRNTIVRFLGRSDNSEVSQARPSETFNPDDPFGVN